MKYLFENAKGKVYKSPIDKMRFLIQEFNFNMPILRSYSASNMPVYKIFPEGLNLQKQAIIQKLILPPTGH
ncbi:MAG: hypothetical protein ABI237_06545 [Ginsengibacter sp.]